MTEIVTKLVELERNTSKIKGDFDLFALFLREDETNLWDLLVAADWIEKDKISAIKYLSEEIQKALLPEELVMLSRLIVIEENNPALPALFQSISVEHSSMEVTNSNFFGLQIKHAYIITSKRRNASPTPSPR